MPEPLHLILHRAQGKSPQAIALSYGVGRSTVSTIVKRYNEGGLSSLLRDKTRKPGKAPIDQVIKHKIYQAAGHEQPKNASHWNVREFAKKFGVSKTAVHTIVRRRDIKRRLVKTFAFSTDNQFEEQLTDVTGLYLPQCQQLKKLRYPAGALRL